MATLAADPTIAARKNLVPVEVYLTSMFHPDCDYLDGELLERNVGELPHGKLQTFFGWYFRDHQQDWGTSASTEQRVQVTSTRYRVPDVCLIAGDAPEEDILLTPPLVCVEILSREDRMSEMMERVEDYLSIGVTSVWVIDPWRRKASVIGADRKIVSEATLLQVPGTRIQVPVGEMFAELDRRPKQDKV